MVLIIYRIIANIPVILMGETGCGKTALIKKLNQLLNDGKSNLEIINIHPGISDNYLVEKMKQINIKAKNTNEDIWAFFDELNTCDSFAILTEIFSNRSFEGENLCNNIKIIGACNPYRIREESKVKCGLSHPNDKFDELVYLVKLMPQSLMYYVFNFGSINEEDESKYIKSIISKHFNKDEEKLKEETKNVICSCHKFLRKKFDLSVVSLREISRFSKCYKFFIDYFKKKNEYNKSIKQDKTENLKEDGKEKIEKILSIIISVYICYYIRLTEKETREEFDKSLLDQFVKLINWESTKKEKKNGKLLERIYNEDFKHYIKETLIEIKQFSNILEFEQEFILDKVELDKGIGHSRSLRENLFILFVSLGTNIPLIIIGKPGSGKSLSSHLIYKSMKGKYSTNDFFKFYPSIIQSYFQGSNSTTPEDVENVFKISEGKLESFKENDGNTPISMLLFDELGLAEKSKYNPLKVLHSKLDEYFNEHIQNKDNLNVENIQRVCFVGITNWTLDAAKLNRALSLSVPDLDEDLGDLIETSTTIAKSFNDNFAENVKKDNDNGENKENNQNIKSNNVQIFEELLPSVYYYYKKTLRDLKELTTKKKYDLQNNEKKREPLKNVRHNDDFKKLLLEENTIDIDLHGNRDYFNLIKGVARELNETNEIEDSKSVVSIIEKYIERNFGGMEINIDIDENDIELNNNYIKDLENQKTITSVKFFKCIYNSFINDGDNQIIYKDYIIEKIDNYNIIKCIYDNVKDENSRYLLLEIKPSLAFLIHQNIEKKFNMIKKVYFTEGSPFIKDEGMEYQYGVLNDIQDHAKNENGHLLFLQNLGSIYPFLYDLFNMNYTIKDGKTYARICHGNYSDQLALINKRFRIVIMADKKFLDQMESPFLSRFEKINIKFKELLNESQKKIAIDLMKDECNFKNMISKIKNHLIYNIKDLLIGCKKEDIQGLVYDFSKDNENIENIKLNVIKKLVKLLPQDIIINLNNEEKIKKEYFKNKKFYNIRDYIREKEDIFKISIIYTFNNIADNIPVLDDYGESIFISEIKSEKDLAKRIQDIISNYKKALKSKRYIYLRFIQSDSQKLNFVITFLKNILEKESINFICIIHIKRNFDKKDRNNNKKGINDFEKIYNIPNLYSNVEQLFIDNLNIMKEGDDNNKINLETILQSSVKELLNYINLEKEFIKTMRIFINNNISNNSKLLKGENDNINQENYLTKIEDYFKNDKTFMNNIIEKAKTFIDFKGDNLIKEIYDKSYINKNSIDIISVIFDYIKEKLISQYIMDIFYNLEDNNFFTSLLVLTNQKNEMLNEELIEEIKENCLNDLKYKQKEKYDLKFDLNYFIPGFYNIFRELSNIISKNYSDSFMKNEKKLREFYKGNKEDAVSYFDDTESEIIERLFEILKNDENKNIYNMINLIRNHENLILDDYITFYLDKYYCNNTNANTINNSCYLSFGDAYHKVIMYLLNKRFKQNNNINEEKDDNNSNNNSYNNDDNDEKIKSILKKICWLKSNINYIIDILEIYKELKGNFENEKEDKLFEIMKNNIEKLNIKYITNEEKNPEITTRVNECYYLILASIIYSVLPPYIDFKNKKTLQLSYYLDSLKNSLKIIGNLNDNLYIYLNEMYIIDEFVKIYETLESNNKVDLNLLNTISETLRINSEIIQKNKDNYSDELIENYKKLYELINKNLTYTDKNYYALLQYIFFKEIKKIKDIDYRTAIFADLIKENEVIKNSINIFQILLKDLIKPVKEQFAKSIDNISNDKSQIIQIMENILNNKNENNYFALTETLLYFFEKNSLTYLNKILKDFWKINNKKENITLDDEKEPLNVFKKCIINLDEYNDKNSTDDKNKNISKLFSIGFIKTFCFMFINFIEKNENDKLKNPSKIIKEINKSKTSSKIITLYIYKIIYNINHKYAYLFSIKEFIDKYKLKEYKHFNDFKIKEDDSELANQFNLDKDYESIYDIIEKYKFQKFKNVNINEFKSEGIDKGIDKFYFASSNLILSNLTKKEFDKSETYTNFYNNICKIIFKSPTLLKAIKLFYDPAKFSKIKKEFEIDNDILKILIFSYRYCINELNSNTKNSIFGLFYDKNKINEINKYYYPGNDIKNIPIYDVYIKILNHFKEKPKQGCFICMCKDGYYYSTRDEEPNTKDLDVKCQFCEEPIGAIKDRTRIIPVKRDNYFRILTQEEYEYKQKRDFHEYDYKMINDFKEQYIDKNFQEERGITKIDENHLKKDNKAIRDLSQVSYRLLNFILYSHLFFARLCNEDKKFDNYLPQNMKWGKLINQLWELLKIELNNNGVNSIELFMNYIFNELFKKLNESTNIKEYQALKKMEKELNTLIDDKIKLFKKEYNKEIKQANEEIDKSNEHFIYNLLKEKYTDLDIEEYPFYQNFFYSDYLNEDCLLELLKLKDKEKYPVLLKKLENQKSKKDKFSLNNLELFNKVLNLINEKYLFKISREEAEKTLLKDEEIYKENSEIIDNFIVFYNDLKKKNETKKILILDKESKLSNFFIDDNTDFGKSYKDIYHDFSNKQNNELNNLLDIKIDKEILDKNCKKKVNIQNINENEIFTLSLPKNFSFIDIIFNHSYRKALIDNDYKSYNQFIIDLESIEETMTELLLKNKKLLNGNIINFIYINEDLTFDNNDIITKFNNNQIIEKIDLDDKIILYEFYEEHYEDINLLLSIIDNFNQLIIFLNNNINNNKIADEISGKKDISSAINFLDDKLSEEFKEIFENKKNMTINKITNLFIYYLRLIFDKSIKDQFNEYQIQEEDIEEKKRNKIIKYFSDENHLINKEKFRDALRLLISLYLFKEDEKENKIKNNVNNISNYLNIKDIWIDISTNKREFKDELKEIKQLNIQINQILTIYELIISDEEKEKDEKYYDEVINGIEKRKNEANGGDLEEEEENHKQIEINEVNNNGEEEPEEVEEVEDPGDRD